MATPIDRDELRVKLEDGMIRLVDAQAPGWYEREHLPGALRAAADDVDGLLRALGAGHNAAIAVYCWNAACTGSAYVAEQLEARGYRNVRRSVGGKQDWTDSGLPIESKR